MSNETKFIDGLRFKEPNERAPEYVKAKGSIKVADLLAWLQQQSGEWVNFDVKVSQSGNWYAAVDDWKPQQQTGNGTARRTAPTAPSRKPDVHQQPADDFADDSIPFVTNRGVF